MRKAIPSITEPVPELKQRLQREHDGRKKPRIQMLYLLASGAVDTRQEVAHLLGVSRNTIGRWLALYEGGGVAALLRITKPTGKAPSLPPEVLASIEQALRQPAGFGSYDELRRWIERTHHVQVKSQNPLHHRTDAIQSQTQRATPEPHTKRLKRVPPFSQRVLSNSARSVATPRTTGLRCLPRMKAASACSRCAAGASLPVACSPLAPFSTRSKASMCMVP